MQFLKILFWCLLAFVAALFTIGNWATVPIHLWGGLIADVNLPLLLAFVFLLGFVPLYAYYRAIRWRLRQRLASAERALADMRMLTPPPPPPPPPPPVVAEPPMPEPPVTAPAAPLPPATV